MISSQRAKEQRDFSQMLTALYTPCVVILQQSQWQQQLLPITGKSHTQCGTMKDE